MYIVVLILLLHVTDISGHGMLMDPVNRGSAWRKKFKTPINYDDNANYCGGFSVHYGLNKGKCGVCGDNFAIRQPRPNENGGKYGTGTIVKTFAAGDEFTATVKITANHKGYFEFALCPLKSPRDIETEECFQSHPIRTVDGKTRYDLTKFEPGIFQVRLILPANVACQHCTLRWHWRAANNWGKCPNGKGALGCGPQETFRTCSDIRIVKPY